MKKLNVLALTGAMVATMSVSAFAGNVQSTVSDEAAKVDGGAFSYDLVAAGYVPTSVKSITFTFTIDDSDGFGGGLMMNGKVSGWVQDDDHASWANAVLEDKTSNVVAEGADGTYTMTLKLDGSQSEKFNASAFGAASDLDNPDDYYAQVVIQQWWGADATITGVSVDGDKVDSGEATGDVAPVAYLAAIVAIAGVAMVASKKRA